MDEFWTTCAFFGVPGVLLFLVVLATKVEQLTSRLAALENRTRAIEEWLPTLWAAVVRESSPDGAPPDGKGEVAREVVEAEPSKPIPMTPSTEGDTEEPVTQPAESEEGAPAEPPSIPPETPTAEPSTPSAPIPSTEPVTTDPPARQESAVSEITSGWSRLEESLGARLPVWLGAIALALAGAFLVKYSVEQGWLRPVVRVVLGVSFGLGLEVAAMFLRRSADRIAAGLAAAGIAVLYASFLAAVHLYSLLPVVVGFALMAVTTLAAVGLSLLHGPIVAIVGMVGGFLAPYWLSADEPEAPRLFAYLLLLHAGLLAVSRKRSWPLLPLASLTLSLVWVAGFLGLAFQPGDGPWLIAFLLLALVLWLAAEGWVAAGTAEPGVDGGAGTPRHVATLAAGFAVLVLAGSVTWAEGFDGITWGLMILLTAGLVYLGRRRVEMEALAWLAALAMLVASEVWKVAPGPDPATALVVGGLVSLTLILVGGGLVAVRGAPAPERWAAFAALSGLLLFRDLVAWQPSVVPFGDVTQGVIAFALAGVFTAAMGLLDDRFGGRSGAEKSPSTKGGAASVDVELQVGWVLGLTATLFASWGVYFLSGGWVRTAAWALLAAFLVWLAGRPRVRDLVWLALVPASLAFADLLAAELLLLYPDRLSDPLLETVLRIVSFLAAMILSIAQAERGAARRLPGAGRVALTFRVYALVALAVFAFRFTQILTARATSNPFVQDGAVNLALLALALALLVAVRRWPGGLGRVEKVGALVLTGLALVVATVQLIVSNPLWTGDPVGGWPVFNHLLWVYGCVALLTVLVARLAVDDGGVSRVRLSWLPPVLYVTSLFYLLILVTFEILQGFRGADLSSAPAAPLAERWALSVGWLLLGMLLLVAGIAARYRLLRAAALAVTGLAVVKVFLVDIGRLGDLYRVLSFLGLGLSLLLLAWLYQRFVFRRTSGPGG